MSLPPLGAIIGSVLSSFLLNSLGRKSTIIIAAVFLSNSFLIIGLAEHFMSVRMIQWGRAISGLGVGLGIPSTTIYVAECSSPSLRGKLSSLPPFMLSLGVLTGYIFGELNMFCVCISRTLYVGMKLPWHLLAYFCSGPPALLVFGMLILPETPSYLASKGLLNEAQEAFAKLRGQDQDR